jgi:hypothetical protein
MNAREIRPDKRVAPLSGGDNLFLAGSIEMGKAIEWQREAVKYFGGYNLNIYNPRCEDFNPDLLQSFTNRDFTSQVVWEQKKLMLCSLVLFNFVEDTKAPISLKELGQQAMIEKKTVVVCCPKGFWKRGNIEVSCALYGMFLYETLEEAMAHIRVLLEFKQS